MRKYIRLVARAGWAITDQGLSALSNLVVTVVLARLLDKEGFGAYSVAFLVFMVGVSVERAIVGQPLQIGHSGDEDEEFRDALRGAMGAALLIGVLASATCIGIRYFGPPPLGPAMSALALTMPALLMMDAARMACFARTDAKGATLLDLAWNVALAVLLVVLLSTGQASLFPLTLAWGASSAAGLVIAWYRLRLGVSLRATIHWLRFHASLWGYLLGEYVIGLGAAQIAILIAGAVTSPVEVGSLRGAQVILGPLGILGTAAFQFAIPELSKREHLTPRQRAHLAWLLSAALASVVPVYMAIMLWLPEKYGVLAFGDTWTGARGVLVPMAISSFFSTLGTGPAVTLYSLGQTRLTFRLHAAKAPVLLAGITVGSLHWGAGGAAWALAGAEAAFLPAWIFAMRRALAAADRDPRGSAASKTARGVRETPDLESRRDSTPVGPSAPDSCEFDPGQAATLPSTAHHVTSKGNHATGPHGPS